MFVRIVGSVVLALALNGVAQARPPQNAQDATSEASPAYTQDVPPEVLRQVEQDTGGRVLGAEATGDSYRVKVLLPGGRVRTVEVKR